MQNNEESEQVSPDVKKFKRRNIENKKGKQTLTLPPINDQKELRSVTSLKAYDKVKVNKIGGVIQLASNTPKISQTLSQPSLTIPDKVVKPLLTPKRKGRNIKNENFATATSQHSI